MSNAMRLGKRTLAGVAAMGLGAGLLVGLGSTSAQAATVTANGPLRAAALASNVAADDSLAFTAITQTGAGQFYTTDDTSALTLVSGPGISTPEGEGIDILAVAVDAENVSFGGGGLSPLNGDDSVALITTSTGAVVEEDTPGAGYRFVETGVTVPDTTALRVGLFVNILDDGWELYVPTAGTYSFLSGAANTSWNVTTTGSPTSVVFTPTTRTVANTEGAETEYRVTIRDSANRPTQFVGAEGLTITSGDDSVILNADDSDIPVGIDEFWSKGYFDLSVEIAAGGVALPGNKSIAAAGNAFASSLEASATLNVADVAPVSALALTVPANAYAVPTVDDSYWVQPGTTSLTFEATQSPGATTNEVNFVTTQNGDILDSSLETAVAGKATYSVTLSPAQAAAGQRVQVTAGGQEVEVAFVQPTAIFQVAPAAQVRATSVGGSTSWNVVVATQYGAPLSGWTVTLTTTSSSRNASADIEATTSAAGAATVTLPDASTSTTNLTDVVTIEPTLGTQTAINATPSSTGIATNSFGSTVRYSAAGSVNLTNLRFNNTAPALFTTRPTVPFQGAASAPATADDTSLVAVSVTASVPGTTVTFSGSEGVLFTDENAAVALADAEATVDIVSNATTGLATAYYLSTKTGANEVKATSSSGVEVKGEITNVSAPAAARFFTLAKSEDRQAVNTAATITVTVTDGFGNPVVLTPAGGSTVTLVTDLGTFGSGATLAVVNATDARGQVGLSLISSVVGKATVTAAGEGGQFRAIADVPVTGWAAGTRTGSIEVEFTPSETKSIAIAGSRTTVNGKPGILIDGLTTGIENGKTVIPYFRFPGSTEYTQGSARPVVNDDEFTWQRKTGKKFYAYVTNDDGAVKSNRVIIPAK